MAGIKPPSPQKIWRFSSAHFYRKVISEKNKLWYNILGVINGIVGLYTRDVSIVNTGAVYFRIVAFSYIPMAVSNIFSSWLRCREHATIPFLASFGAVAVNTGLNYLLIFGKFGFPCMGIKGAAIATLISQLFNLVFIAVGFALCIRKDGDKPVWSLRFSKITVRAYRRST
jgi:Na+-driven multidrug efflux pump